MASGVIACRPDCPRLLLGKDTLSVEGAIPVLPSQTGGEWTGGASERWPWHAWTGGHSWVLPQSACWLW